MKRLPLIAARRCLAAGADDDVPTIWANTSDGTRQQLLLAFAHVRVDT